MRAARTPNCSTVPPPAVDLAVGRYLRLAAIAPSPARFETDTDMRTFFPRFAEEAMRANQGLVQMRETVAVRQGATPAQVALAWLLHQDPCVVPIPGTRRLERLDENLASADLSLSVSDLDEIQAALGRMEIAGGRGTGQEQYR